MRCGKAKKLWENHFRDVIFSMTRRTQESSAEAVHGAAIAGSFLFFAIISYTAFATRYCIATSLEAAAD